MPQYSTVQYSSLVNTIFDDMLLSFVRLLFIPEVKYCGKRRQARNLDDSINKTIIISFFSTIITYFYGNDCIEHVPNIRYSDPGNQSGELLPLMTSDPVGAIFTPFFDWAEFLGGD